MAFHQTLQSVTLHTNLGDIKCEIFCDEVPKTSEVCAFSYFVIPKFKVLVSLARTLNP
nr:peptidyl-prolyl cis-trans isomerase CYP18-1 [Ipomoea batatas]